VSSELSICADHMTGRYTEQRIEGLERTRDRARISLRKRSTPEPGLWRTDDSVHPPYQFRVFAYIWV